MLILLGGHISACKDEIKPEKFVAVKDQDAERKQIEATTSLMEEEKERRKQLIKIRFLILSKKSVNFSYKNGKDVIFYK